tara:strand:- start:187 stop:579 length:393 start_codon:yes stop_codon:yes gene_type:complete
MKKKIPKKLLREFGFLLGFFFPIFIGWILPAISGHSFRSFTLWIGASFFLLALIRPKLLFYPYKTWMKISDILGWLNSRLLLGIFFYMMLLPIALLMRLFGHDPLRTKSIDQKSYREMRLNNKINLKKIF